ncbi:TPA: ATP-binding cassette domain-containing protein, partial [Streptococcus agalactiae]
MTENRKKIVEVKNVSLTFNKGKANEVRAIDNVSFDIYEGEVFGLVGESGSGKTTVGRSILKLYDISDGEITFNGEVISHLKGKALHSFRKD